MRELEKLRRLPQHFAKCLTSQFAYDISKLRFDGRRARPLGTSPRAWGGFLRIYDDANLEDQHNYETEVLLLKDLPKQIFFTISCSID